MKFNFCCLFGLLILNANSQVKAGKDSSMPDGSTSMMSMSGLSVAMSDIDSNYDTMSISGHQKMSSVDYGRQKKK